MKKIYLKLFYFFVLAIIISCDYGGDVYFTQESKVTIQGIVRLTCNGVPLNPEDFPYDISKSNRNMPIIQAFTTQPQFTPLYEDGFFLGTFCNTQSIEGSVNNLITWIGDGEYKWSMEIIGISLPQTLYFWVLTTMDGVYDSWSITPSITDGIQVTNEDSIIDIGLFNYNVAQLSGKLPVTINGSPEIAMMDIFLSDGRYLCLIEIGVDGEWSQYAIVPEEETALTFRIAVHKNGGVFSKDLATSTVYTINNTDTEFIFPDYRSIDFTAYTLSGTIKMFSPHGDQPRNGNITFFKDGIDISKIFSHYFVLGSAEVQYLHWNGDGSAVWETMLPAFSFPERFQLSISGASGNFHYWESIAIEITDITDLRNIDLGSFFH